MPSPLTTSGTYGYSASVVDLLSASLRISQVIGAEETATGAQLQNGMDAMAAMCKAWQASGIHIWAEEEGILFLNGGQTLYQIGAGSPDHVTLWQTLISTSLQATASSGATTLILNSVNGGIDNQSAVTAGDTIGVQLDSGVNFWTTVSGAPT